MKILLLKIKHLYYKIMYKLFKTELTFPKHYYHILNMEEFFKNFWNDKNFIPAKTIKYINRYPGWCDIYLGDYKGIPVYTPLAKN